QPWFIDSDTNSKVTGVMLKTRVDALARGLQSAWGLGVYSSDLEQHREYGIRDVVGVVSRNSLDFGTMIWACHKGGATVACVSAGGTVGEVQHQLSLSGARAALVHIDSLDVVLQAAEQCAIEMDQIAVSGLAGRPLREQYAARGMRTIEQLIDQGKELLRADLLRTADAIQLRGYPRVPIAFLCFSSGTTGLPKAAILSHAAIIANVEQLTQSSVPTSRVITGDKALGVIPFYHIFGLVTLVHLCPKLGVATVVFPSMPPFPVFLEKLARFGINHLFLAPPLVNAFVKHPATPSVELTFMKSAMIAAAPLSAGVEEAFAVLGGDDFLVTQVFGMTECGGMITGLALDRSPIPGSVATTMVHTVAKIIDDRGESIPIGSQRRGQLCVRGPQLCLGYLNNRAATQDAFDEDGYLYTGDVAEMSEDGNIRIVDRVKSLIKTKGYQVPPAELEAELLRLAFVADVAVIGKPHQRYGEVPVAFVVLSAAGEAHVKCDGTAVKETIKAAIRETKSEYKWLHEVHFLKTIPRLPSGKILAVRLLDMLAK
ncbi:hypothetical protein GGX14DRAFT_610650, partial [Mycena pura]